MSFVIEKGLQYETLILSKDFFNREKNRFLYKNEIKYFDIFFSTFFNICYKHKIVFIIHWNNIYEILSFLI